MRKVELFINDVSVPLANEFGINFTKTIADISMPEARQSAFSQTVVIPGTKDVNVLFNYLFDVNVDSTFDAKKKVDAVYFEDSIEQLRGFFRLVSISTEDDEVIYTGSIHGELSSIFKDMGDSLLSDLDFSDMDHTYNAANVQAGFTPTLGTDFYYPMLDYFSKTNYDLWVTTDFRPAIWFKEYVDRIFALYGFTFSSTFLDSTLFKSICMPAISGIVNLSALQITDRSFFVERDSGGGGSDQQLFMAVSTEGGKTQEMEFDIDTGGFFNTVGDDYAIPPNVAAGQWGVQWEGLYQFSFDINSVMQYDGAGGNANGTDVFYEINVIRRRSGQADVTIHTEDVNSTWSVGSPIPTGTKSVSVNSVFTFNADIQQFDTVFIRFQFINFKSVIFTTFESFQSFSFFFEQASTWKLDLLTKTLTVGTNLDMTTMIPKMTQKAFMLGIIRAFNLYIEDLGDKELLIEPRDDGYYTQDIIDWTNKKNGKITLFPNEQLQGRLYDFRFQDESDSLHDRYKRDVGIDYGNKEFRVDDDFKTQTKTIELPWASTLNAGPESATSANPNNRPIATMFFVDDLGAVTEGDAKPRMLFAVPELSAPIVAGSPGWTYNGGGALAEYPYAGDFSLPYGANTIMLDFQTPAQVYYDGDIPIVDTNKIGFGGDTLFSFYEQMMADIVNPVMKAQFYLDVLDVFNISFRKRYFIDTVYYRLLKVSKEGELYNCEFLKIE